MSDHRNTDMLYNTIELIAYILMFFSKLPCSIWAT